MIVFDRDDARFNYRVGGVAYHEQTVLLQSAAGLDFWFLPGGRVEMLETAEQALRREIQEELHVTPSVGRLLWVNENFFAMGGRRYHELGLYFALELPPDVPDVGEFAAHDPNVELRMRWAPLNQLPDIRPGFLMDALLHPPISTRHIVFQD